MKRNKDSDDALVYSTDTGMVKPKPDKKVAAPSPSDGIIRIHRESKGRSGKGVSLIKGLPLAEAELKKLAKELKQRCGTGGTVKNGIIEIQGNQRELLLTELEKRGYKAKIAGS